MSLAGLILITRFQITRCNCYYFFLKFVKYNKKCKTNIFSKKIWDDNYIYGKKRSCCWNCCLYDPEQKIKHVRYRVPLWQLFLTE